MEFCFRTTLPVSGSCPATRSRSLLAFRNARRALAFLSGLALRHALLLSPVPIVVIALVREPLLLLWCTDRAHTAAGVLDAGLLTISSHRNQNSTKNRHQNTELKQHCQQREKHPTNPPSSSLTVQPYHRLADQQSNHRDEKKQRPNNDLGRTLNLKPVGEKQQEKITRRAEKCCQPNDHAQPNRHASLRLRNSSIHMPSV